MAFSYHPPLPRENCLQRPPSMLLPIAMVCSLATFSSTHAQSAEPAPSATKTAQASPADASAKSAQYTQAVSWNLPAGPLDDTLTRIARQGQRSISASPALLAGKRAPAVQGSYSVERAAQLALAGSGLRLASTPNGTLTVWQDSAATASVPVSGSAVAGASSAEHALAEVRVTAHADSSGTTEGTGAYTAQGPTSMSTGLALSLRDTPQSISVITQQRMEDESLTTINEVLMRTPGISTSVLGTERSNANARGYAITNYQIDGVSTHSEFLGLDALPTQSIADMALYDRVEVLRGASGLTTGAGDPSGIVNLVRKKPTEQFQASAEASAGSFGNRRAMVDISSPLNEAGTVRGRFVGVHQDADSHIDFYSKKKDVLYGVIQADLTSTLQLTAGLDHQRSRSRGSMSYLGFPLFNSEGQQNQFPTSFNSASRDNRFNTNSTTTFAALEQSLPDNWKLKLSANHLRSSQREDAVYLNVNAAPFDPVTGDGLKLNAERRDYRLRNKTFDIHVRGPITLGGREHELVFGMDHTSFQSYTDGSLDVSGLRGKPVNIYQWDNNGKPVFNNPTVVYDSTRSQSSVYGAGRFALADSLKLIVGGKLMNYRSDYVTTNTSGYYANSPASENRIFTPYAGLIYTLSPQHTLYTSYSTIYNPQTSRDRNGAFLDPQEGNTYEAGIKSDWLGGRLNSSAAIYQIRQDNLATDDPGQFIPGTTDTASRAIKGAKTHGIDLEVNGAITPDWAITASYNFSASKDAKGARINTTFPRHMARLWTTYRMPGEWRKLTVGGGVNWNSGISYTGEIWQIGKEATARQGAYAVVGLMARYQVNDKLALSLNVNNLFDRKYIAAMSGWWYSGMYGTPRSVQVSARYNF
ncbi:TonB-dependent siderophore receptor [Comamonas suwonensis]|uniref:TonB-dependent siderophore receptor n=1 Tax=Comamonas suwonensis TaxID=2606214 RepID=UPI001F3925E2|nr:TonB-dependent receptor [Comamonas suwonensis]